MELMKIQISKTDCDASQEYSVEIPLVDMNEVFDGYGD